MQIHLWSYVEIVNVHPYLYNDTCTTLCHDMTLIWKPCFVLSMENIFWTIFASNQKIIINIRNCSSTSEIWKSCDKSINKVIRRHLVLYLISVIILKNEIWRKHIFWVKIPCQSCMSALLISCVLQHCTAADEGILPDLLLFCWIFCQ